MTRRTISREERNRIIIENAKSLIRNQGIVSFKFSDLGRISNCSNSTVYDLFNCKEDVIVTIFNNNLSRMYDFNCALMKYQKASPKQKLYTIQLQELFSISSTHNADSICNFFGVSQFVSDHADPYLTSETFRLLKRLRSQRESILREAIISGDLQMTEEDIESSDFELLSMLSYRGMVALCMNKFSNELSLDITEEKMHKITSNNIEMLPWISNEVPSLELIKEIFEDLNCGPIES
ncbi:hypothetical protein [Shewanella sp. GXUN23E]|uniref:hypothetical protein n=1 Tax=Shewanella sp. GXUN23E TaxID=3422498 RepID=UPI003D7D18FE